jgi:p-hydroxybenzoate 3-monooxygenase
MTVKERTQVGIVGAGPAGLLLSHLLALGGIETHLIEIRHQAHCEARQRAGMLEPATVQLLRDTGLGRRLDAEGLEHDGIYLQFAGERHHVNFRELSDGRPLTIYPQTEIVKDLIRARTASGGTLEFGATDTELADLDTHQPVLRYTDRNGLRREVTCDAIAGCDGYRGICRPAIPAGRLRLTAQRTYPFSWLGILAQAPPSTDQVIYCRHNRGFALHSMRTPEISRLYLQVPADDDISRWPDDRIWEELSVRLAVPGWKLRTGPVLDKGITAMRHFVAAPMRQLPVVVDDLNAPRAAPPGPFRLCPPDRPAAKPDHLTGRRQHAGRELYRGRAPLRPVGGRLPRGAAIGRRRRRRPTVSPTEPRAGMRVCPNLVPDKRKMIFR